MELTDPGPSGRPQLYRQVNLDKVAVELLLTPRREPTVRQPNTSPSQEGGERRGMARLSASKGQAVGQIGGISGTWVPKPLSPRGRSRVARWDRGTGADVRQRYRTRTNYIGVIGWARLYTIRTFSRSLTVWPLGYESSAGRPARQDLFLLETDSSRLYLRIRAATYDQASPEPPRD